MALYARIDGRDIAAEKSDEDDAIGSGKSTIEL
jgi:hypothetical protein